VKTDTLPEGVLEWYANLGLLILRIEVFRLYDAYYGVFELHQLGECNPATF
jgi:hypothetical protein